MDPLRQELKEFLELHTLLSSEYIKYPLPSEDLDYFANYMTKLVHVRMQKCLEADDLPQAESFIAETQASMGGIEESLRNRLHKVSVAEMNFFNREWKRISFWSFVRSGVKSGIPSKAERQKAARTAYREEVREVVRP